MATETEIMEIGVLGFVEVVNGQIINLSPNSYKQNRIAQNIYRQLRAYSAHGFLTNGHMSYVLKRNGDDIQTLRLPDVSYMRNEPDFSQQALLPRTPTLAVKVVAVYETVSQLEQQISDYLQAGSEQVWLVYPDMEEVYCYLENGLTLRYTHTDTMIVTGLFPLRAEIPIQRFFDSSSKKNLLR
jgi:Uma2 family endonuclease